MKWIAILLVLIVLAAGGWYFISPIFNVVEVQDEAPDFIREVPDEQTEEEPEVKEKEEVLPEETEGVDLSFYGPFPVEGTFGHPAGGELIVFEDEAGQTLRYENFSTINGPNLHLYLSKDKDATDYIDLGPIKGTKGNINYQVPAGVDLSEYKYVLTWCVPFSVLFNYVKVEL